MTALIGPHNDDDADETGLPASQADPAGDVRREPSLTRKRDNVQGPIAYMLAGALVGVVATLAAMTVVFPVPAPATITWGSRGEQMTSSCSWLKGIPRSEHRSPGSASPVMPGFPG